MDDETYLFPDEYATLFTYIFPMPFWKFLEMVHTLVQFITPPTIRLNLEPMYAGDRFYFKLINFDVYIVRNKAFEECYESLGEGHVLEHTSFHKFTLCKVALGWYPAVQEVCINNLANHVMYNSFFRRNNYCVTRRYRLGTKFCPILLHHDFIFKHLVEGIDLNKENKIIL